MSEFLDVVSFLASAIGVLFFAAGSIGLNRLPDVFSRLHAVSKADNLGMGLIVFAAMLQSESWFAVAKLAAIWVLVLIASACLCSLIAGESYRHAGKKDLS